MIHCKAGWIYRARLPACVHFVAASFARRLHRRTITNPLSSSGYILATILSYITVVDCKTELLFLSQESAFHKIYQMVYIFFMYIVMGYTFRRLHNKKQS